MSVEEFAQKIKERNPSLRNMDDNDVVNLVLKNYPEYIGEVDLGPNFQPTSKPVQEIHKNMFETAKTKIEKDMELKNMSFLQKAGEVLKGIPKGLLSTLKGASTLGERVVGAPYRAITGEKFESSAQKLQDISEQGLGLQQGALTEPANKYQKAGKFIEQVGEYALPQIALGKMISGANLATKIGTRAVTGAGVASLQEGEIGKGAAIAGGLEIAFPFLGKVTKPVRAVFSRLFKSLGAGLSGVSTATLEEIKANPQLAIDASKEIIEKGQQSILKKNTEAILEGVSKIRKETRAMYGKALEKLSKIDIKPKVIYENTIKSLEKHGIKFRDNKIDLSSMEIFDKNILKKVKEVVNLVNKQTEATGKDLRRIMEQIESIKFKTTGGNPDRLAFNAFLKDLREGLKKGINESTGKLKEINKKFSDDMGLAESIEKIFGKVKFKNRAEIESIARKLEKLFSREGFDEQTIREFLNRIGVKEEEFFTSEAVRSVYKQQFRENTLGLNWREVTQAITSSAITPTMVKNIAIMTGVAENVLNAIIKHTNPEIRALIIESIIKNQNE